MTDSEWAAMHELVEARLVDDGQEHLVQMGRLYVENLRWAAKLRAEAEAKPTTTLRSGRAVTHSGFAVADRLVRTALQIARALELNEPRRQEPTQPQGVAELYAFERLDELAPGRRPTRNGRAR